MLPISGPKSRVTQNNGPTNSLGGTPVWLRKEQTWYRQKKPYNMPLTFTSHTLQVTSHLNSWNYSRSYTSLLWEPSFSRNKESVYRGVYAKYLNKVRGDAADLLTAFCERGKTADMIHARADSLWRGLVAAKRGDIAALKRYWGRNSGIRRRLKAAGGHVLEYSFGWAPLVNDIATAVDTLKQGSAPHKGTVKHSYTFLDSKLVDYTSSRGVFKWSALHAYRVGWEARVTHPSLLLLNQLGLVNPVATLWEMTPWSFVVDYFVNVNDVIQSMTATAGIELSNSYTTWFYRCENVESLYWAPGFTKTPYPTNSWTGRIVTQTRAPGIAAPKLGVRSPWNLSWKRALTSVALLLQQLH